LGKIETVAFRKEGMRIFSNESLLAASLISAIVDEPVSITLATIVRISGLDIEATRNRPLSD